MTEHRQIQAEGRQAGGRRLKAFISNSWLLLGNVLLLVGGDDSVELCLTAPSLELTQQPSAALVANLAKEQGA